MTNIKWIKIATDIFDNEKLKLIDTMPAADSIITIWFKLLVLAGKSNNDGVFLFIDTTPYNEEMLAGVFNRDLNTVRLSLETLERFGMIERVNGVITIPGWSEYQSLDKYEALKEKDRVRKKAVRERQRLLALGEPEKLLPDVRGLSAESPGTRPDIVRECPAADKDIDKDIDKEGEEDIYDPPAGKSLSKQDEAFLRRHLSDA